MKLWLVILALGILTLAVPARAGGGPVVLGQINISFYAVTAAVVHEVLQRLGHEVEVKTGSHGQIFPMLGQGEVDLLVAAWLPSAHADYWNKYGGDAVQLGALYSNAQLYWAVPPYVPEAMVSRIADLKKPEVAGKMVKTIRATAPDSGLTIGSGRIMTHYRLAEAGYELLPGNRDQWVAHLEENLAAERWFVMPFFRPNYLNLMADMRILEEPQKLLGEASNGTLVAHRNFVSRMPQSTTDVLGRIQLGLDAVAQMDRMVNIDKMSPRDAARAWMEQNRAVVDVWFN